MPCAIILAAGISSRLGQPKQNLRIAGETLLERTVRIAREASLAPIFVIVSPDLAHAPLPEATIVLNHQAAEGMASSIRCGVRAAIEANATGALITAAIILACDQVAITAHHLQQLCSENSRDEIAASRYAGRNGIPAYFPAAAFLDLLTLRGDTGARDLLHRARTVPLTNGDLDIDTAEDLARARLLYENETP